MHSSETENIRKDAPATDNVLVENAPAAGEVLVENAPVGDDGRVENVPAADDDLVENALEDAVSGEKTKKGAWNRGLVTLLSLAAVAVVLIVLNLALYPCTFMRNDVHTISTEQRDVVIMGTSCGKMGIDPDALLAGTGFTGHNLCVGGEYPTDAYYLMQLALEKQDPKMVIYEIDPGYFMGQKEVGNNYLLFYHEFPMGKTKLAYFMDLLKEHDFRTLFFPYYEYPLQSSLPRVKDTLYQRLTGNYDVSYLKGQVLEYHESGFLEHYPVAQENFPAANHVVFDAGSIAPENVEYLEKLIALCKERGIYFIAVSMPLPEETLAADAESLENAWTYFSKFMREQQVPYLNFNAEFAPAYSHRADHFVDYDGHLNGDSAREFSGILGSILVNNNLLPARS